MASENAYDEAGLVVERNVAVRMRDGIKLSVNIHRPAGAGHWPVLLSRHPYNKDVAQTYVYNHPAWYARRGYVVVVEDTRGRFGSEGEFYPMRLDAEDGFDTIAWCARLPYSNGKVGTFGFSYPGLNQLLAATLGPPNLVAAAPAMYAGAGGLYDGFVYVGGAFALSAVAHWAVILAADFAKRRGSAADVAVIAAADNAVGRWHPGTPINQIPLLDRPDLMPFFADFLAHPTRSAAWKESDLSECPGTVDIPCLHIGGWYDTFINQTLACYERLRLRGVAEHRLLIGPWAHIPWNTKIGRVDFGPEAQNIVDYWHIAWFDAWLKGDRRQLEDLPKVRVFVLGANGWRDYDSWPPTGMVRQRFYLHSGGRANSRAGDGRLSPDAPGVEPPDFYVYNPAEPVPSVGGHSGFYPERTPMGAADQRAVELRTDVLVYTSAPLEKPLEIAGPVTAELWAASSARDTDFTLKLCDVDPEGHSINLCDGIIRARYRNGPNEPILLEPDQLYRYLINLSAVAARFAAGHRIRVQIASSDFPAYDRNPNTGGDFKRVSLLDFQAATQAVFHSDTRSSFIELPVVSSS